MFATDREKLSGGARADDRCDHCRAQACSTPQIGKGATRIQAVLRAKHVGQPEVVTAAYAATTRAAAAALRTPDEQDKILQGQVDAAFWSAQGR
jgi:hypothetical protein